MCVCACVATCTKACTLRSTSCKVDNPYRQLRVDNPRLLPLILTYLPSSKWQQIVSNAIVSILSLSSFALLFFLNIIILILIVYYYLLLKNSSALPTCNPRMYCNYYDNDMKTLPSNRLIIHLSWRNRRLNDV